VLRVVLQLWDFVAVGSQMVGDGLAQLEAAFELEGLEHGTLGQQLDDAFVVELAQGSPFRKPVAGRVDRESWLDVQVLQVRTAVADGGHRVNRDGVVNDGVEDNLERLEPGAVGCDEA